MRLIIDAHSWIEYLKGSSSGEKLNEMLKGENEIIVLPITIAEVTAKVKRNKGDIDSAYNVIIKTLKFLSQLQA